MAADPAGRRAVVGGGDLDAAVEMHGAAAVFVVAERLERQRAEGRTLLGEHGGDLALRRAVDAGVGPALLPAVQVGLGGVELLEAEATERRLLGVADGSLDLALPIRVPDAARQGDDAVVGEHVAVERIELGVVDVGGEDALLQVIEVVCPFVICGPTAGMDPALVGRTSSARPHNGSQRSEPGQQGLVVAPNSTSAG